MLTMESTSPAAPHISSGVPFPPAKRSWRCMPALGADRSGVAAIEFALILPVMLVIYLTGFDVARMVRASDKTENASRTLADLTAQEPTNAAVPNSDITTFIQAAALAALPFNNANLTITVSAVDLTLNGVTCCNATVRWSITQGGTLRPCKTTLRQIDPTDVWDPTTIPKKIATQAVVVAGAAQTSIYETAVIVTDVSYTYTGFSPGLSTLISQRIMRHSYSIPRNPGQITLVNGTGLPTGMAANVC